MDKTEIKHWADQTAENVIRLFGDKKTYTCATGISPSGTVHFGNFRETITTDLIVKALQSKGKTVRFIYSWDDYDRLRKVPANVGKGFESYIGAPYSRIPDPFGCHKSYAEHFEIEYEDSLPKLGVKPKFIRQHEMYEACKYAEEIKTAMNSTEKIKEILNKYRKSPVEKNWYPAVVYCERCGKDTTEVKEYDNNYTIRYKCECGHEDIVNFKEKGIVKLKWRVDWPMRWHYEEVEFEPAGKEHSTPGGSRTTSNQIVEVVWNRKPPVHLMYDFIILKGVGGKMSGSLGNAIALKDVLEVYESSIIRYLFASTRPNTEFFISFDLDVFKVYEDFDKCERIFFNKEEAKDEKEYLKQKRIYEFSEIAIPEKQPIQPLFRHLSNLIQIYKDDFKSIKEQYRKDLKTDFDLERLKSRIACAKRWIEKYAPDEMRFHVQEGVSDEIRKQLTIKQKNSLNLLRQKLKEKEYDEKPLFEEFYTISKETDLDPKEFFKGAYLVLIAKEKGPKLAPFILTIGKEKVIELIEKI